MSNTEPIDIVVAIDQNSDECAYVGGVAWEHTGETTVYVADLVELAKGRPIRLTHLTTHSYVSGWPKTLEELKKVADYEEDH